MKVKLTHTQTALQKIDLTSPHDLKRLEYKGYHGGGKGCKYIHKGKSYQGGKIPNIHITGVHGNVRGFRVKLSMERCSNPVVGEYVWVRGRAKRNHLGYSMWVYAMVKVLSTEFKQVRVKLLFNRQVCMVNRKSLFLERG